MGFSKVRPSLFFRAELEAEITEWFRSNTQQDAIGVSNFASQFLDGNMYKSIFETGCESNKYSAGETNEEHTVPDLTRHAKPTVDVEITDFHSQLRISQR